MILLSTLVIKLKELLSVKVRFDINLVKVIYEVSKVSGSIASILSFTASYAHKMPDILFY